MFLAVQAIPAAQRNSSVSNIYAVEMHPWQKCYYSWSKNWQIHLYQKRKLPLPPFASATTFYIPFFLSATSDTIRALSNGTTQNKNLCIGWVTKRLTWRSWTLQSDWRALYRPRGTNHCMAVLPDPFSIFPKGSGHEARMMHESKGQHFGKAPSLHLFHTTVRQHPWELLLNLLPSMQLLMLCISITMTSDQSAVHSSTGSRLYV